jgi:hypothetical protein
MVKDNSTIKNDHYYAEFLGLMREQGKKDNPPTIQLGIMESEDKVRIDDLILNAEDLYIADYLKKGYTRKLLYAYESEAGVQEDITYDDGLKAGDIVAVQRLNNNMFAILARVVRV